MKKIKELKTEDLVLINGNLELRPLYLETLDLEHVVTIANDYNIAKYIGHIFPSPYNVEHAKSFQDYAKSAWEKDTEYVWGIFIDSEYAGNMGIKVDYDNEIVKNLGYWLGKKYEGQGCMSRAVKLMTVFCFNILNVRKIEAGVFEGNIGSAKVLEKNGFVLEGVKKKNQKLKDGSILDTSIYGLLK